MMVTFFWKCPFPHLVEIREHPEFHDLVETDKPSWPRRLLWHGWLPLLSGVSGGSPWAGSPREGASNHLESCLGRYSSDALAEWQPPVCFDAVASALEGRLGRVVSPIAAVVFGRIGGGASWMKMLGRMQLLVPVVVFVLCLVHCSLCLVHCSLFRGLSSGVLFLLCRQSMGCVWE